MYLNPYANDEWSGECQPLNPVIDSIQKDKEWTELMQFTGLYDKNGKEVYEGDICKYYHHPNDVVVISYDEELLSNKATVVSDGIYCEDYIFIKTDNFKFEVIGNKWENPELIA